MSHYFASVLTIAHYFALFRAVSHDFTLIHTIVHRCVLVHTISYYFIILRDCVHAFALCYFVLLRAIVHYLVWAVSHYFAARSLVHTIACHCALLRTSVCLRTCAHYVASCGVWFHSMAICSQYCALLCTLWHDLVVFRNLVHYSAPKRFAWLRTIANDFAPLHTKCFALRTMCFCIIVYIQNSHFCTPLRTLVGLFRISNNRKLLQSISHVFALVRTNSKHFTFLFHTTHTTWTFAK